MQIYLQKSPGKVYFGSKLNEKGTKKASRKTRFFSVRYDELNERRSVV